MMAAILFLIFIVVYLKTGILDQVQCGRAFLDPLCKCCFQYE